MSGVRSWAAGRRRTHLSLNLPELASLAEAALASGAGERRADRDLASAARRVIAARDRRIRAVERAQK